MSTDSFTSQPENRRILVIDDNPSIHEDFRKILSPAETKLAAGLDADEAALFGETANTARSWSFQIDSAFQGEEGLEKVRAAATAGAPYAVAFVDVRMPPGWDGIETISRIWKEFPDLQMVVCTAYSDYSWDEIAKTIGNTDQMLVLKKPFDNVEVLQMAHALARKWELTQIAHRQMEDLEALVDERTAELRRANQELTSEVAERTMAESALRHSEERFSKAFHGSPLPMAIRRLDIHGYVDVNASFVALLGTSREGALAEDSLFWSDPGTEARISAELAAGQAIRELPTTIRTRAGETRDVLVTAQILKLGDAPYQLFILQDITARTRLENELRQAQKMEAVGQLAAGVAHDFNNILTVILGNTSLQLRNPDLDEKLNASLQQVERAAERATSLTRQLLAYSRKQIIHRRPLALNDVVEQTIAMLRRIIGEHITIETRLAPGLPPIFADPSSVDQVIMNLALNSRDAMPEGGRLTLTTSEVVIDEAGGVRSPDAEPGPYLCLEVEDTGNGMEADVVARIFEPFFTTKEPGKGTGMGLATVYGVLKQHGGWIEVESAPRAGTTIRAFFPLSNEPIVVADGAEPEKLPTNCLPPADVTILVVEDEDTLREFVGQSLSVLGYRVLTAANGVDALKIWSEHREEIDLLMTDMVMPESISGRQLAHTLIIEKPDLKVIFTSGYSADLLGEDFEQSNDCGFLAKPYLPDRLASTIATCLQREPAMAS
jgi:two-component system cell cycle sensor histidine kinase/response regulator CckA